MQPVRLFNALCSASDSLAIRLQCAGCTWFHGQTHLRLIVFHTSGSMRCTHSLCCCVCCHSRYPYRPHDHEVRLLQPHRRLLWCGPYFLHTPHLPKAFLKDRTSCAGHCARISLARDFGVQLMLFCTLVSRVSLAHTAISE
jgi:hypothetical protein